MVKVTDVRTSRGVFGGFGSWLQDRGRGEDENVNETRSRVDGGASGAAVFVPGYRVSAHAAAALARCPGGNAYDVKTRHG
jgi:hypothetical protein